MSRFYITQSLTIANGQTTSGAFECRDFAIFGLVLPATMTGTLLSFTVSADGTTFQALHDDTNTAVTLALTVSKSYLLPPELAAWHSFKIVSGSAEGADRTLVITAKG
jgi:hypothetical protein